MLFHQVVGDNLDRIVSVLEFAASRTDVVIATGGLRATEDDITRDAIARVMDAASTVIPARALVARAVRRFGAGSMPENNLRQADAGGPHDRERPWLCPGLVAD